MEVHFYQKIRKTGDQQNKKSRTKSNTLTQTKIFCAKILKFKMNLNESH